MEVHKRNDELPQVTDDDFLATLEQTKEKLWQDLAHSQPQLAREIEQQADAIRQMLEAEIAEGKIDTLDIQQRMIDMNVFSVKSLIYALRTRLGKNNLETGQNPLMTA